MRGDLGTDKYLAATWHRASADCVDHGPVSHERIKDRGHDRERQDAGDVRRDHVRGGGANPGVHCLELRGIREHGRNVFGRRRHDERPAGFCVDDRLCRNCGLCRDRLGLCGVGHFLLLCIWVWVWFWVWVGRVCGHVGNLCIRKCGHCYQAEIPQHGFGHGHDALGVGRKRDGSSANAHGVVRACLKERDRIAGCAGVCQRRFELEARRRICERVHDAAQLCDVVILNQLCGLLAHVERAARKLHTGAVRNGRHDIPGDR